MPRYYFGYGSGAPETLGDELADDDAARDVAALMAEELGRHLAVWPRITIFDEAFKDFGDPDAPLVCITTVVDGVPVANRVVRL